jgi:5-methyltetrahydropteroyltriglutamate--homocysteine methyltransferase
VLQIDAPDLAMERVLLFQDMSDMEYAKLVEQHVLTEKNSLDPYPRIRSLLGVAPEKYWREVRRTHSS